EPEGLEPCGTGERAAVVPERHRLVVAVGDDDVAQHADSVAALASRYLGIELEETALELRVERRQDGGDAFLGTPADAALRGRERLEYRWVRLLHRFRHYADLADDPALDAGAPLAGPLPGS